MTIKMIAVDMDGTFLNSEGDYDRERFKKQYLQLKDMGVRFVVASGNQYYQLKSFYGDFQDELAYVAENGSFVVDRGEEIFAANLPKEDAMFIADELLKYPELAVALCGKNSAYLLETESDEIFHFINKYYHRLERVTDFREVNDQLFKFALLCPVDDTMRIYEELKSKIGHLIVPVTSGHGSIDLGMPDVNKASGITYLEKRWNIKPDEIMAFGDSGNDLEMLKHVKYGFAMANAAEDVKEAASFMAPSNDESGVLEVIDRFLKGEGEFRS